MKKLGIFLMSALVLGFTSCDNYEFENPTPQNNPQEEMLLIESVTEAVTHGADLTGETLDLNAFKESEVGINVLKIGEVKNLPAGQEFDVVMQIALTEDFAKAENLKVNVDTKGNAFVDADEWADIHVKKFSKSPKAKDTYARFIVSLVKGNQKVRIGDEKTFFAAKKVTVTPYPSELVIEQNYYILGTLNNWSVAEAIKLDHEGDPYDNPVFTIKVDINPDQATSGWWWKIVPQSTFETGNWVDAKNASYGVEVNGDESLEGILFARTDTQDCGAGCIKEAGQWLLTLNFEEGTYAFTSAVDYLYTPGDANGWNQANSQRLFTTDYANYCGFAVLSPNGFKFSTAPDWDHTNFGAGEAEGTLSNDGGAGNLSVAEKGTYFCNVNISALTYNVAKVNTIGVVGNATPGGWDASTALSSRDGLLWEGKIKFGEGEYKFRANDAWDINLGGDVNNLLPGGANIPTPGVGEYYIVLDLSRLPYTVVYDKAN